MIRLREQSISSKVVAISPWLPVILASDWCARKREQELTSLRFSHEQAAQPEKHQARLAAHHVPQETCGLIAVDFAERLPRRSVQQIHQLRIILLLKMVQRAADQPVRPQFTPQGGKLAAPAIPQNCLRDAERPAKAGNDSPHG